MNAGQVAHSINIPVAGYTAPPVSADKIRQKKREHPDWNYGQIAKDLGIGYQKVYQALYHERPSLSVASAGAVNTMELAASRLLLERIEKKTRAIEAGTPVEFVIDGEIVSGITASTVTPPAPNGLWATHLRGMQQMFTMLESKIADLEADNKRLREITDRLKAVWGEPAVKP